MRKTFLVLLFISSYIIGMDKSYSLSYEYKTYDLEKPTIHSLTKYEPNKDLPSKVYFQVTATESRFYIPVQKQKKEPTYIDKKVLKLAEKHHQTLYNAAMGVSDLRYTLKKLSTHYAIYKNGMSSTDRVILEKEIALIKSCLAKYGVPDLECIQGSLPIKEAVGIYRGLLNKKAVDPKIKEAALKRLKRRKSYEVFLKQEQESKASAKPVESDVLSSTSEVVLNSADSFLQTVDLVSTPAMTVPNISKEIDARVEVVLQALKNNKDTSFNDCMQSVDTVLQNLKSQGSLESSKDLTREAIIHGVTHFLNEFNPSSVAEHPGEFAYNIATYAGIAIFHIATDGAFIGTQKAVLLGAELQSLFEMMTRDHSELSSNQYAELIAEKVADFVKIIFADKVARKVAPNLKVPTNFKPSGTIDVLEGREPALATPEGLVVKGPQAIEDANVLLNTFDKAGKTGTKPEKTVVQQVNKFVSKDEVRRIILNRERDVLPSDLKTLGFRGERCTKLNYVDKKNGNIDLFTEIKGGLEKAKETLAAIKNEFECRSQLIQKVHDEAKQRAFFKFSDGSKVQLRIEGKSGHPKVDVTDIFKNVEEKITFI